RRRSRLRQRRNTRPRPPGGDGANGRSQGALWRAQIDRGSDRRWGRAGRCAPSRAVGHVGIPSAQRHPRDFGGGYAARPARSPGPRGGSRPRAGATGDRRGPAGGGVRPTGWRRAPLSGAAVFAAKEVREIWRTWRIWVLPGIVLFFAVTGPFLA